MTRLRNVCNVWLLAFACCAFALTGCDSGTGDDPDDGEVPDPEVFTGNPALLGMWTDEVVAEGEDRGFIFFEHDESAGTLRFRIWSQNAEAGCFDIDEAGARSIPLSNVTPTTLRIDGRAVTYNIAGSTLTFQDPASDVPPEVLIRSDLTPESMTPECPEG